MPIRKENLREGNEMEREMRWGWEGLRSVAYRRSFLMALASSSHFFASCGESAWTSEGLSNR